AAGAGHGTYIPFAIFASPLPALTWPLSLVHGSAVIAAIFTLLCFAAIPVMWAVAFGFAAIARRKARGRGFVMAMAAHYVIAIVLITVSPVSDWAYVHRVGAWFVASLLVYGGGQLVL